MLSRDYVRPFASQRFLSFVCIMAVLSTLGLALHIQPTSFNSRASMNVAQGSELETASWSFFPVFGVEDQPKGYRVQSVRGQFEFTRTGVVLSTNPGSNSVAPYIAETDMSTIDSTTLSLEFLGSSEAVQLVPERPLPGTVNYFLGNNQSTWRTNVSTFAALMYQDLYPGIDLRYEGSTGQLKGTYYLESGVDPSVIRWKWEGAKSAVIDEEGNLQVVLSGNPGFIANQNKGDMIESTPIAWQDIEGTQQPVSVHYLLHDDNSVGFSVQSYNSNYPLVIDPTLSFSTFLGGSGYEIGQDIAVDATGNIYVMGFTSSIDFPTTPNAPIMIGSAGGLDVFVAKLDPSGSTLLYGTYLGGSNSECADVWNLCGLDVDGEGNAYITGWTRSEDFPTTFGSFDTSYNGNDDAFVAKLSPDGSSLLYSTYLGGSGTDHAHRLTIDQSGAVYVVGDTSSANFPTTAGSFRSSFNMSHDAFLVKMNATGSTLAYSTYLGGSAYKDYAKDVAVDDAGHAYVVGYTASPDFPVTPGALDTTCGTDGACNNSLSDDGFVVKFLSDGSGLAYGTFLGGSGSDYAFALDVEPDGAAYITGYCGGTSGHFTGLTDPVWADHCPASSYVIKLDPDGAATSYGILIGGNGWDQSHDIVIDTTGRAYVTGATGSSNFPVTPDGADTSINGNYDVFVVRLDPFGAIDYGTFLGGSGYEYGYGIAVDEAGSIYVTGRTESPDFLVTDAYQTSFKGDGDAFVVKLSDNLPPVANAGGPYVTAEGSSINISASASDPDGDSLSVSWSVDASQCTFSDPAVLDPTITCFDNGDFVLTLEVSDGVNVSVRDTTSLTILDANPDAMFEWNPELPLEGSIVQFNDLSVSYPDDIVAWNWSLSTQATNNDQNPGFAFEDDGTYTVCLTVTDDDGSTDSACNNVLVENVPPTIVNVTGPIEPVSINDQPINIDVTFSDPGIADIHRVTWKWGDGMTDELQDVISPASAAHVYQEPGVYAVEVTVTDDDGDSDIETYEFVVVFDTDGGFVTGGGWIFSESGWCQFNDLCANAFGKANFGFVSKYKHGASIPTGNTEFNLSAGDFNFHSEEYDWLVVNQGGSNAQFKGSGTINGDLAPTGAPYRFMIWAKDLDPNSLDTFRIKIWFDDNGEVVVYDNGFSQPIGGGNIKVHTR